MAEMLTYEQTLTSTTGGARHLPHGVLALRGSAVAPADEDYRGGQGGQGRGRRGRRRLAQQRERDRARAQQDDERCRRPCPGRASASSSSPARRRAPSPPRRRPAGWRCSSRPPAGVTRNTDEIVSVTKNSTALTVPTALAGSTLLISEGRRRDGPPAPAAQGVDERGREPDDQQAARARHRVPVLPLPGEPHDDHDAEDEQDARHDDPDGRRVLVGHRRQGPPHGAGDARHQQRPEQALLDVADRGSG